MHWISLNRDGKAIGIQNATVQRCGDVPQPGRVNTNLILLVCRWTYQKILEEKLWHPQVVCELKRLPSGVLNNKVYLLAFALSLCYIDPFIVAGGHSLYFRNFFKTFMAAKAEHAAKVVSYCVIYAYYNYNVIYIVFFTFSFCLNLLIWWFDKFSLFLFVIEKKNCKWRSCCFYTSESVWWKQNMVI